MEAQVLALRHAIQLLYGPTSRLEQQRADSWLQDFRNTPEAWLLCLELLSNPGTGEPEAYFAANTLRFICGKSAMLVSMDVASQLFPKLVQCLFIALASSKWAVAAQLSTALAVLMLRTNTWSAQHLISDFEKLVLGQLAQFQQHNTNMQPAVAHIAMLQVMAALPVACADKQCSVHPNRRMTVTDALAASPHIQPWIQAAFAAHEQQPPGPMKQLYLTLGLQLIHGWCELGTLPLSLPQQLNIVQHVCYASLRAETASSGAEALVSMLTACKDVASQGSDLLLLLVQCWQDAMSTVPLQGPNSMASHDILQAMCLVLCAAATALLPFSLGPDNHLKTQFIRVAEQLMGHLTSDDAEVALSALEFWQGMYITTLQGLPSASRQAAITVHTPLLQHLTASLVLRGQLDSRVAANATADARDLPEEVRMVRMKQRQVRRELAGALRDVTTLVGLVSMSQYIAALVQRQWGQLLEANASQVDKAWAVLECALYSANVVLGQRPSAHSKRKEAANNAAVTALVDVCTACLMRSSELCLHPKLLGTALTLLGGLAAWLNEQPDVLRGLLPALLLVVKSNDEKLARNAATTVYRLCQHAGLASQILSMHQGWVESLLQHYRACGGVQRRIGTGTDLPTEELLLASLCRLATQTSTTNAFYGNNLLMYLSEPKLQELRQAIVGLIACAPVALQMLAGSSASGNSNRSGAGYCDGVTTFTSLTSAGQVQSCNLEPCSQAELSRAGGLAAQVGMCLDVLHMIVENAGSPGKGREVSMPQQSIAGSSTGSPQGVFSHDRERTSDREMTNGHAFSNGNTNMGTLQKAGSISDSFSNSCSGMSRTSSFTSSAPPAFQSGGVSLILQESACSEQVLALVRSTWSILQPCMQQLQSLTQVMGPACTLFTCALRSSSHHMQHDMLLLSLQLVAALPARVLVTPKGLGLLVACLESYRPACPLPSRSDNHLNASAMSQANNASSNMQVSQSLSIHFPIQQSGSRSDGGGVSNTASIAPQPTLLQATQAAILQACQPSTLPVLAADSETLRPVISLCMSAVQTLPGVFLLQGVLEHVLLMTLATGRSYEVDQCRHWLEWVVLLTTAPYGGLRNRQPNSLPSSLRQMQPTLKLNFAPVENGSPLPPNGSPAGQTSGHLHEGLAMLGHMLDSGAGAQIVLAMLMAASGEMPPDLVANIAVAMHQIWSIVGTHRFSSWIEKAVIELATDQAPWYKQKHESKLASLQEIVSVDTEYDVGRFKKLVKAFCGGKKKIGFGSLPGSRSVSRSNSTLSSSFQMSA